MSDYPHAPVWFGYEGDGDSCAAAFRLGRTGHLDIALSAEDPEGKPLGVAKDIDVDDLIECLLELKRRGREGRE